MHWKLAFSDVASGAVADTFKTIAAMVCADSAENRVRLRSLNLGPTDDAPVDLNLGVRILRIADVSAGTSGTYSSVSTSSIAKVNSFQTNSLASGRIDYSAEPTTYETEPLWEHSFNARGGFIKEWSREGGPVIEADQLLGVLVAPRTASAIRVSGTLEFEDAF